MQKPPSANQGLNDDEIVWQRVTQGITPLSGRNLTISSSSSVKKLAYPAKPAQKISKKKLLPLNSSNEILHPLLPIDLREGNRAGLDGRTQRRLVRGDMQIDRRLDLHGYTAARAEIRLKRFIEDASYAGSRCVLVITGKGAGVLKGHMPRWLKKPPLLSLVLALAEARPADGGSGAFYVLLRRRR